MVGEDKKMVEHPDKELQTVEDYNEYQKWAQSLPQRDRIKLIIDSFKSLLEKQVFLAADPKQTYPVVFIFKNKELLEKISQELASRKIYMPEYTDAERVERAKVQVEMKDKSVALASIMTALMTEIQSDIASTWWEDLEHGDCMIVFKDVELAYYMIGKEPPDGSTGTDTA